MNNENEQNNENRNENRTENEFLNLANEFQEIMNQKEEKIKHISRKYMDQKKDFARIYGLIRELIDYLDNSTDIEGDPIYEMLSNGVRTVASENLFGKEYRHLNLEDSSFSLTINNIF